MISQLKKKSFIKKVEYVRYHCLARAFSQNDKSQNLVHHAAGWWSTQTIGNIMKPFQMDSLPHQFNFEFAHKLENSEMRAGFKLKSDPPTSMVTFNC